MTEVPLQQGQHFVPFSFFYTRLTLTSCPISCQNCANGSSVDGCNYLIGKIGENGAPSTERKADVVSADSGYLALDSAMTRTNADFQIPGEKMAV